MDNIKKGKIFGVIGSLFSILVTLPWVGYIFCLAGIVFVLYALKKLSDATLDKKIFIYALEGVILLFLFSFLSLSMFILGIANFVSKSTISDFSPTSTIPYLLFFSPFELFFQPIFEISQTTVFYLILSFILLWCSIILWALFIYHSFVRLYNAFGISIFKLTANLYLIGALTIPLFIGFFIILLGKILQIIGFLEIRET